MTTATLETTTELLTPGQLAVSGQTYAEMADDAGRGGRVNYALVGALLSSGIRLSPTL